MFPAFQGNPLQSAKCEVSNQISLKNVGFSPTRVMHSPVLHSILHIILGGSFCSGEVQNSAEWRARKELVFRP
jgi:hypothetical protein